MALTSAETQRCRYELGYNVLSVGAEPFIGVTQMFEQVIAPFTTSGAITSSHTIVAASVPAAVAEITLISPTGFAAGNRVVIDVEGAQEVTTVRSLVGSVMSVFLTKAHPEGSYPVTVEGGESIIRGILTELRKYSEAGGNISKLAQTAGITRVDEIYFSDNPLVSRSREMRKEQAYWRDELAFALGCENRRGSQSSGGSMVMF